MYHNSRSAARVKRLTASTILNIRQTGHQIEEAKWRQKDDFDLKPGERCGVAFDSLEGNMLWRDGDSGGVVTSMGASCQLDRATIAG
uniref:Uncharacterized protein n=1 Tax=Romanomermis culicivorax TaxID=13658 RepID=A0A915I245_ROMCU